MPRPSYPRPVASKTARERTYPHQALLPLLTPPARSAPFHPLSDAPAGPSPIPGYKRTPHFVSAAYPRTLVNSTYPPADQAAKDQWPPVEGGDKADRMKRAVDEAIQLGRHAEPGVEPYVAEGERVGVGMELVVERFVKEGKWAAGKKQVTLIMGGANGLPVEDWYLPLRRALSHLSATGWTAFEIVEIWLLNTPLTHPSHGTVYTWADNARDFASFVKHFLPSTPSPGLLPEVLERKDDGSRREGIVSVGQSFSASTYLLAELDQAANGGSALSEGMMLVDPMIMDPQGPHFKANTSSATKPSRMTLGAIARPDVWESQASIAPALLKSPFFQAFHPDQLASYVKHGFVPLDLSKPEGEYTLKFPRWAEALVFSRGDATAHVWDELASGAGRVGEGSRGVRFVFPGKGEVSGSEESRAELAHFLPEEIASNVIVPGAGHLIVQERPVEMGEVLGEFLVELFGGGGAEGKRKAKL